MARPTSAPAPRYRCAAPDGRLDSPVFHRNVEPLLAALTPLLEGRSGTAFEIGSGTGQHIAALRRAFPRLVWQASDPDPVHRKSCDAWSPAASPALDIDAASDWPDRPEVAGLAPFALILSLNVVHIAPWSVAIGLVAGAGRALARGGLLALYGPFREDGAHTGPGNAAFDAQLRAQDPAWGLRDTADLRWLAEGAGLAFRALVPMPANNRLMLFERTRLAPGTPGA
jgi:hypothetical protein